MSKKRKPEKKKKPKKASQNKQQSNEVVNYVCLTCSQSEEISLFVVHEFDRMDDGDPEIPPPFRCEACDGEMYPEHYKGIHGHEYRIENRIGKGKATE